MIIEAFTFTYTRLRHLKVAVERITGFTPDGKPAGYVADLSAQAKIALGAALAQKVKTGKARGRLQTVQDEAHASTVMAHACMRSCYRDDQESLESIGGVPTDDKTAAQTLHRMKELSAVWAALPNVPGTNTPFAVKDVTLATFDEQHDDLDDKITDYTKESALLDNEEAKLRVLNGKAERFHFGRVNPRAGAIRRRHAGTGVDRSGAGAAEHAEAGSGDVLADGEPGRRRRAFAVRCGARHEFPGVAQRPG
jgi:hypothetical protein